MRKTLSYIDGFVIAVPIAPGRLLPITASLVQTLKRQVSKRGLLAPQAKILNVGLKITAKGIDIQTAAALEAGEYAK